MKKNLKATLVRCVLLMAVTMPLIAQADQYAHAGVFGQVDYQGMKLTVAEAGYDSAMNATGAAADFVMADGCLFATGHTTGPIQFDGAAALQKNVRASGEIIGHGYDYCHHNRSFEMRVSFNVDLAPFRNEGKAIASKLMAISQDDSALVTQSQDADQMTANANATIHSTITFLNSDYAFTNTATPTEGTIGYLRERKVLVSP